MESLTKNRQSEEALRRMTDKCFPSDEMSGWRELTEGYFNAAYEITLKSGRQIILKIAPSPDVRVMSYEKNLMYSEVKAMEMAQQQPEIPVARVLGYDDSRTVCPCSYFFMEKLEGESLNSILNTMTEEEVQAVRFETGRLNRLINEICCPCFGYPGLPECQGETWYPVFRKMLMMGIEDAERGQVELGIPAGELLLYLERDRSVFEEVTEPRLVHWDLWAGNVFVKDGRVTGLIDWERCLWADPLFEVGFRSHERHPFFLKGYGKETLSPAEERRALWYDIYTALLACQECEYRKYETMEMYDWAIEILKRRFELVRKELGR